MAGDWIKMRVDLADDPAVIGIAARLSLDEFAVVGRLQALWSWADGQSRDGHAAGVTAQWINRKFQCDGFAEAMVAVGWLVVDETGVTLPNFGNHNGETAKTRALGKNRKQRERGKDVGHADVQETSRNVRDESVTREEKRREEISPSLRSGVRATRKCPESFEVTDEMRTWAVEEAPGVDLRTETAKFRDHTFKNAITDWLGAWRNWMRRAVNDVKRNQSSGETAYQRRSRERMQQVVPRIAAQAPGQSNIIEMEVPNVIAGCLGRSNL